MGMNERQQLRSDGSSTMLSDSSRIETKPIPPHHVLMAGDPNSVPLDQELSRDFVSKRHRSLQGSFVAAAEPSTTTTHDTKDSVGEGIWFGVSSVERLLVSCCKVDPLDSGEEAEPISGALARDMILRFLRVLLLHCHDLSSRVLALSILERTLQKDELEREAYEERVAESEALFGSADQPPTKRTKLIGDPEPDAIRQKSSEWVGRIHDFLAAGGMKILRQWLLDASTPVSSSSSTKPPPSARPPKRQVSKPQASPTGPILLILLQFLASMPFDKQVITTSKINKLIRSLSKQIDSLASSQEEVTTHEAAGGLPVTQVKQALDHLKSTWEEKAKDSIGKMSMPLTNPFESLQRALSDRLTALDRFNEGEGDKPEWLAKVEEQQEAKEKKRQSKVMASASTSDLARRERANERAAMMKEDLQRAQEQRRQLVIKLRELKHKNMNEDRQTRQSKSKRSIRWKDGMGPTSTEKKRDLLEEVFAIPSKEDSDDLFDLGDDDMDVNLSESSLSVVDEIVVLDDD